MDLKQKLAALDPARPTPAATHEAGPRSRAGTLEELRSRMAEILGRERTPREPLPEPALGRLPFARIETDRGPLYRRLERLAPSYHVGRMPVDAARAARPEMLALLALDPAIASRDVGRVLFLDTETTGLGGGAGMVAFLVGMGWFEAGGRLELEQLFLRTPAEEPALLAAVAARIAAADLVVTFNGKTFDLPLLDTRFVMNRLAPPARRPHLDLLHVARRLHRARLGACRLISLEADVLGFVRDSDIDGGDVAPRWAHWLRTGDEETLLPVVQHNAWDVASMAALVGLYGEPLEQLHAGDLVPLARTLRRAGALELAGEAADRAVEQAPKPEALRARAEIAKARGDRARALDDFEALAQEVDDPAVRLELAKLYEHWVKDALRALRLVEAGTGESEQAAARRRARLAKKARRGG
jgi:hypothetical protein